MAVKMASLVMVEPVMASTPAVEPVCVSWAASVSAALPPKSGEMELAQGGTLAFAYVTLALIADLQATEEDLEDISSFIGQRCGVVGGGYGAGVVDIQVQHNAHQHGGHQHEQDITGHFCGHGMVSSP